VSVYGRGFVALWITSFFFYLLRLGSTATWRPASPGWRRSRR